MYVACNLWAANTAFSGFFGKILNYLLSRLLTDIYKEIAEGEGGLRSEAATLQIDTLCRSETVVVDHSHHLRQTKPYSMELRSLLDQSEGQECRPECDKRGGMTRTSNSGHFLLELVESCKPGKREF